MMGNKGGVGIRMRINDSAVCFVCSHLAAHREKVAERNADYRKYSPSSSSLPQNPPQSRLLSRPRFSVAASFRAESRRRVLGFPPSLSSPPAGRPQLPHHNRRPKSGRFRPRASRLRLSPQKGPTSPLPTRRFRLPELSRTPHHLSPHLQIYPVFPPIRPASGEKSANARLVRPNSFLPTRRSLQHGFPDSCY